VLGMFIDFFEIAFIVVPILAPVAENMGINLIWFGILLAMNLQTSFLTPPFGFALFYLRSVAAKNDYTDRVTGQRIPAVTTAQIYKGSIAFIVLQLIMVGVILFNPHLVTDSLDTATRMDSTEALEQLRGMGRDAMEANEQAAPPPGEPGASAPSEDPMQMLLDSIQRDRPAGN
jgi:hypothetical protein